MYASQRSRIEIAALNELLNRIPSRSLLGNNHEAIGAQIRVIQERMTEAQLLKEYEDRDPYVLSASLDAFAWLHEDGEPVSAVWFELSPVGEVACAI